MTLGFRWGPGVCLACQEDAPFATQACLAEGVLAWRARETRHSRGAEVTKKPRQANQRGFSTIYDLGHPPQGSGGEDLFEHGVGLVLVRVLREGQLGDQDLAGLAEHPLLAGRQATLTVTAPEVADDLGDLHDVA
jgi:hypothetical protein